MDYVKNILEQISHFKGLYKEKPTEDGLLQAETSVSALLMLFSTSEPQKDFFPQFKKASHTCHNSELSQLL